jgi:hypothetical protein
MRDLGSLKSTLKRGALVTAANWPVIAVQFVAESTFKILLGVPVVGGILVVALALGRDVTDILGGDLRLAVASVATVLLDHPVALAAFVLALLVMILGGSALMFLVKGGTVAVLAAGEAAAGRVEEPPLRLEQVHCAAQYSIGGFLEGCRRLFRRYLRLGLLLLAVYGLSGGLYLVLVIGGYALVSGLGLVVGWTVVAALASGALLVWITIVNLAYLLVQMAIAVEDCSVRTAAGHVIRFLRQRASDVMLVFGVVLVLVVLATAASILATAGLGLISFVPLVGLAVLPLQAAAWLLRGLVFQYLGLTALAAYLALYRTRGAAQGRRPALIRTAS